MDIRTERGSVASEDALWESRFEWLLGFCSSIDWHYDDVSFYDSLAELFVSYAHCDIVTVQLCNATECHIVGSAFVDEQDRKYLGRYGSLPITVGRFPQLAKTLSPIILDFDNPDIHDIRMDVNDEVGLVMGVSMPLVFRGELIGIVNLLSKSRHDLSDDDYRCLSGAMAILAPFVASRQASVHFTEARILDERRMLSAEIHDNLSQIVNTIRLEAEQALESFEQGDGESLKKELGILSEACSMAVTALRDEMLALRDATESATSLIPELEEMTSRFESMWGIKTQLSVVGNVDRIALPKQVLLQVIRVVHEALANVCRHADAENVHVDIQLNDASLSLRVADDGCGFDVDNVAPNRLGLHVMKERSESVDGELAVFSEPGEGTTILAVLPIALGRR